MEIPLSGPAADRSGYAAHDACRDLAVNHRKSLAPGRGREPLIEADNLERGRIVIGRDQGGRELKTIGRPKGVHAQQPLPRAAQGRRRHDLVPAVGEMARDRQRRLNLFRRQRILPFTSRDGRGNLDRRSPPGEYLGVLLEDSEHGLASGLLGQQRHDGGGLPELHGRTRLIAPPADRGAAPRGDGMRGRAACQGRLAASRRGAVRLLNCQAHVPTGTGADARASSSAAGLTPERASDRSEPQNHKRGEIHMKKSLSLITLAAVLFAGPALAADPIIGMWKLNVAKSKFSPGAELTAGIRLYTEVNGTFTLEQKLTGKDGKERSNRVQYRDGEDMKQTLTAGADTTHAKKVDANTWDFDLKKDGKVVGHVHRVVSADGRTLTVHNTGLQLTGAGGDQTLVFDRQ